MGSSLFIILVFVRGARDWVGLVDVKGSFFGILFLVFVRDQWTGEGIRDGWMDGWMDGNRGGNRWCGSGPSLFFLNGARSCTKFIFPKMQPTHRRPFSGTGC